MTQRPFNGVLDAARMKCWFFSHEVNEENEFNDLSVNNFNIYNLF